MYLLHLALVSHAAPEMVAELEGAHLPLLELDVGSELSSTDTLPNVLLAPRFRGIGQSGSHGMHWLPIRGEARLDVEAPDGDRLRGDVAIGRYFGETYPVPVLYDVRFGTFRAMRDERLDLDLDLRAQAVTAMTGFFFPSIEGGDFHGHAVALGGLLGFHRRSYFGAANPDVIGGYLGGVGVDVEAGRALARGVIVSGYLDCTADWSLGLGDQLTVITDSVVDVGGSLRIGRHVALRIGGGAETTRDSGSQLDVHYYRAYAKLRIGT